jgi:hypothetical protein
MPRAVAMGVAAGARLVGAGESGDSSCGGGAKVDATATGRSATSSKTKAWDVAECEEATKMPSW